MTATQDLIPDEPATLLGVVHPQHTHAPNGSKAYSGPEDDTCEICHPDEDAAQPMGLSPTPLDEAAVAIRRAAERVTVQLATLRDARSQINGEIRDLVAEDERLRRLVRILDAK